MTITTINAFIRGGKMKNPTSKIVIPNSFDITSRLFFVICGE